MGSYAAVISLRQTLKRISESDDFLDELYSVLLKMEKIPSIKIVDAAAYERRVVDALLILQDFIDSHLSDHDEIGFTLSLSQQLGIVQEEIASFLTATDQICSSRYSNFASSDYNTDNQQQNLLVGLGDQIRALKQWIFDPISTVKRVFGMTGIGKTSLVKQVYNDPLVIKEFETCLFLHIGPYYTRSEDIMLRVLNELGVVIPSDKLDTDCLQNQFLEALSTQKYLIVLDDVWADGKYLIPSGFPENRKGSRIVIISQIQSSFHYIYADIFIVLPFLNDDDSWKLLHQTAFRNREECCRELEKIGKKIAKNCEGLPAAIIQVGENLRGKSFQEWKTLSEKEDPLVITRYDDTPLSKGLFFSYMMLPWYLKPFFLYMGVFPKHYGISRSKLIKLWVSEGFGETYTGTEETVGYILDLLIGQSVVLREKHASVNMSKVKNCRLHFTFRSLCVSEAKCEKFFHIYTTYKRRNPMVISSIF